MSSVPVQEKKQEIVLTDLEKGILQELVNGSSCGYPVKKFLKALRENHRVDRPLSMARSLCERKFMELKEKKHAGGPAFIPLPLAYEALGIPLKT